MRCRSTILFVIIAAVAASACAVGTDGSPRDIDPAARIELRNATDQAAGVGSGRARIYLVSPDSSSAPQKLQPVSRDVSETVSDLVQALLGGPNATELNGQLRTALPNGTKLLSTSIRGSTATLDLSGDLQSLSGNSLITAMAQLVLTASEASGISDVRIRVEGKNQPWPAGNGQLKDRPLTRYDYPALISSAQPDFPATPSQAAP